MMEKTLGGDRLGSGNKMKVELHGYERSSHNLGKIWRSTMSAGTLVPFLTQVALPGDTWDIDLDVDVKTHPTVGPLFGSYKVQLDLFQAPIRLYNSLLHNNMLNIGMDMSKVKLPQITLTPRAFTPGTEDYDNSQINPSSLLAYLGIRGIGAVDETGPTRNFNAVPLLLYWEIYKNYYSNKQEKKGAFIHAAPVDIEETVDEISVTIPGIGGVVIPPYPDIAAGTWIWTEGTQIKVDYTGATPNPDTIYINLHNLGSFPYSQLVNYVDDTNPGYLIGEWDATFGTTFGLNWNYLSGSVPIQQKPRVQTFELANIDTMRKQILAFQSESAPFIANSGTTPSPYGFIGFAPGGYPVDLNSQQGLGLKTYQSDLFNNWLDTTWVDGIGTASAVSTVGDMFTIDQLILSNNVYKLLNRIAVSGGSYNDWQDAVWAHDRPRLIESPMYEGGLIRELVFQEVVSNTETDNQALGTLAGKGVMASKRKGGKVVIKVNEPSYIMGIVSLTPRIDYSQGNRWDVHLQTMDDLHKPQLDQIGFQDLITEQMAWWSTEWDDANDKWVQKSAGKQPAWINYMTDINETHGNFAIADNEMFMTLNRRYERASTHDILDLTSYIDPSKFNFIFAETAIDSQNFWVQIGMDITARRKMSAKMMPNL